MKNNPPMKDYIAIIFGDFATQQKVYDTMMTIIPVVESDNLKFQYNDLSIICHFENRESQEDIKDFFMAALSDISNMFFLTETKHISFSMDQEISQHLMNLEVTDNINMVIDMDKIRNGKDGFLKQDLLNIPIVFDNFDEDDDDEIKLLQKKSAKPSLDELLEKIHQQGYEKLSTEEIKLLNNYSN